MTSSKQLALPEAHPCKRAYGVLRSSLTHRVAPGLTFKRSGAAGAAEAVPLRITDARVKPRLKFRLVRGSRGSAGCASGAALRRRGRRTRCWACRATRTWRRSSVRSSSARSSCTRTSTRRCAAAAVFLKPHWLLSYCRPAITRLVYRRESLQAHLPVMILVCACSSTL